MSRKLIDMDTLTEMIKRICCHAEDETDLLDVLKEMPTIDAVEVVRCKDCKYGSKCLLDMIQCKVYGVLHSADWFCADGEVKNDEIS